MKEIYINPLMEVCEFQNIDVITTSDGYDPDNDETEILRF